MYLSGSAQPFEPLDFAIYNDGVPASVFYGSHPEHDVVQHIPDEAIDEIFPATADDVAELEAAEDFVETMAWLAYLDECDEAARYSFAGFKKRWSARRKAGLIGKPLPARGARGARNPDFDEVVLMGRLRSGTITSTSSVDLSTGSPSALVPYVPRIFEVKPRKFEARMYGGARGGMSKHARGMHGHRAVIHQPRKHY